MQPLGLWRPKGIHCSNTHRNITHMHTQSCLAVYFPCCYFVLVLLPSYQKFSSLKYWLCQKPFFLKKSVCCMSWGQYERFTVYCTGAITYTLSCFYIKWKWASLTDGSAVALDILQLFFLRPKCSHVFHIWPAVQLTSTCCSCHFSCCMCLCVFIPTHEYVLATRHVHPRATHGQPLYSATVALAKSLAGHTAAGNRGVRKGTSPQFSEGRREASLGWQSLKRGLAGWGSWLTVFDSRTCQYQRLMIKAALVCHRGCHLSYSYR